MSVHQIRVVSVSLSRNAETGGVSWRIPVKADTVSATLGTLLYFWHSLCHHHHSCTEQSHVAPSACRSPATARRALTRCLFGVIAHEALPRPRFLAVAEQIEEPHFFQVHLHVVQVLGQQGEKPKALRWRTAAVSTSEPPSQQALTCPCTSLITSST